MIKIGVLLWIPLDHWNPVGDTGFGDPLDRVAAAIGWVERGAERKAVSPTAFLPENHGYDTSSCHTGHLERAGRQSHGAEICWNVNGVLRGEIAGDEEAASGPQKAVGSTEISVCHETTRHAVEAAGHLRDGVGMFAIATITGDGEAGHRDAMGTQDGEQQDQFTKMQHGEYHRRSGGEAVSYFVQARYR